MNEIANSFQELPIGWTWAKIEDMISSEGEFIDGDWVESKDQDENGDVRLIQLADIGDGYYRNKSSRFLTYEKAVELKCTFLEVGDVLLARMPDPLGRCCLFPGDEKKSVTVVDVCIIRPGLNSVNKNWLMYFINASEFRAQIASLQSGSTRKRISRGNLSTLYLPLPPLPEQHRIVAKLEELFTKLDVSVAELKKAKAQIKRYRQSVLKHAFEGKLTEEWRKQTSNVKGETAEELLAKIKEERKKALGKKYKELPPVDTTNLPQLPEGWVWTRMDEFLCEIKDGTHDTPKYFLSGIPFITQKNIKIDGISFENVQYISEEDHGKFYLRSNPTKDDILISMIGASRGKSCIVNSDAIFSIKNVGLFKPYRLHNNIHYVQYYLRSKLGQELIQNNSKGGAQPFIGLTELREWPVIVTSKEEQDQIVSEIERHFSVADETEKIIDQSLKQAERLRQSILKEAFSGKLVPQDPSDEPAEKLLERIRAERTKLTPAKRTKRDMKKK